MNIARKRLWKFVFCTEDDHAIFTNYSIAVLRPYPMLLFFQSFLSFRWLLFQVPLVHILPYSLNSVLIQFRSSCSYRWYPAHRKILFGSLLLLIRCAWPSYTNFYFNHFTILSHIPNFVFHFSFLIRSHSIIHWSDALHAITF